MTRALSTSVVLLTLTCSTAGAQTQAQLTESAARAARRADSTLNALYSQLEQRYASDTLALRKLRAAQHAWLAYREAEIEAAYPATDKQQYGSVIGMCMASLRSDITDARVNELRRRLSSLANEGDVCAGGPVQ